MSVLPLLQDLDLSRFEHIIGKLGEDCTQNYILNLGRELVEERDMVKIIEVGAQVLIRLIQNQYVKIEKVDRGQKIIPLIPYEQTKEAMKKAYPIRTEKHINNVNPYNFKLGDKHYNLVLHNEWKAPINSNNLNVLMKLNNIEFEVTSDYSEYKRTPKNVEALNDINYQQETQLFKETQQEWNKKSIYFFHQFDSRGRIYSKGYTLNYQGDKYSKCAIDLAHARFLNDKGYKWLIRDIANQYGMDKSSFAEKDDWGEANKDFIYNTAKKDIIHPEADDPVRLIKACKALVKAESGKPINYLTGIDATASGISIMSLLARDLKGCRYTNLLEDENRYDIYTEVTKELMEFSTKPKSIERMKKARAEVKKAVMIYFYNGRKKVTDLFRGDAKWIAIFEEVVAKTCKGAYETMQLLNETFIKAKDRPYLMWQLPDGFMAITPQWDKRFHRISNLYFTSTITYEVVAPNEKYNKRGYAPNVVHSIDGFICREMIRRLKSEMITTHDCFYTHPNDCDDVISNYKNILQEINDGQYSNILENIISDTAGVRLENPFKSRQPIPDINNAIHSLC